MRYKRTLRLITAALPVCLAGIPAQALTPPKIYSVSPTGVNLLDTDYTYSHTDLTIGSLSLERSYMSGPDTTSKLFSNGWTNNFDMRAEYAGPFSDQKVIIVLGRTKYVFFGVAGSSGPYSPDFDAQGTTLQYTDHYTFIDRHGVVYQFNPGVRGNIASITYPTGYKITVTSVSGKPKLITDNKGYALVLDYGTYGVTAACGFNLASTYVTASTTCAAAPVKTSYGYTTNALGMGLLSSFTDTRNFTSGFGYDAMGLLNCVRLPDSSTCQVSNTYDSGNHGHVVQQTMGDGAVWQFACSCGFDGKDDNQDPADFEDDYTLITDPRGGGLSYTFHGLGLNGIWDQNNQRTQVSYTSGHLDSVVLPEGNEIDFLANVRLEDFGHTFRPKPGSTASPITIGNSTFPSDCANRVTCNLPTTVADGNNNITTYTYDPVHGGVLTETKPAGSGGVSQVIRHHYAQRYAWIKNSAGAYAPAAAPIWVLTDDHTCTSGATSGETCVAGAAKEVVTTYEYGPDSGPNNLLLRGKVVTADGKSLRTCFLYDSQGNKIAETSPRAGLATCS